MHALLTSTALGLVAAWPVGALGFGLGRLVERLTDDPRPRAAAWSLAYVLPAAALAATVVLTLSPTAAPSKVAPIAAGRVAATVEMPAGPGPAAPAWRPSPLLADSLAWSLVGLSAAGLLARGWRWNGGRRRLAKVRAAAAPCRDETLLRAVQARAARLSVKAPRVRISPAVSEPLLAGALRPVILLPQALAETADTRRLELVCGHELAHLRRGDNWRIPVEEGVAGLFWLVPPIKAVRARMLAAREAVCDLAALDGAAPDARQDYARVLVEALRLNALPAAQSAFTGRERSLVALRLAAILQPRRRASTLRIGLTLALGGALTAATGYGSLALAEQARRLAPLASPETVAAAETIAATAEDDAAPAAPADEAAPAAEVAEVAEAAPAAEAAPVLAEAAVAAELTPLAPTQARLGRHPDSRPNPHPNPQPNPHPNPQPSPRPESKLEGLEFRADAQQTFNTVDKVVFTGDVEVRGRIDPINVVVKVNGVQAAPWFQPEDLRVGVIQRVEVTNTRASSGTPVVDITLK